jgi:hypothetical protein
VRDGAGATHGERCGCRRWLSVRDRVTDKGREEASALRLYAVSSRPKICDAAEPAISHVSAQVAAMVAAGSVVGAAKSVKFENKNLTVSNLKIVLKKC